MRELKAKATNARKAIPTDALAISVNSSFPQFDCQSSTRVAADEAADMRRYASICNQINKPSITFDCKNMYIAHDVNIKEVQAHRKKMSRGSIRVDNFLHDLQTQHKINGLRLMGSDPFN